MSEIKRPTYQTGDPVFEEKIESLLTEWGVTDDLDTYRQMMVTVLKLARDEPHPADLRLFKNAFKEMRYADKIFKPYRNVKKISVFGSARTPPTEPEYQTAFKFAERMRQDGFMIITGGGDGIMGAAQAGAGREDSFALNITLPFEQDANETIRGDHKLVLFKYFFTRKVNFVKNSDAVTLCPGGFGTMDEGFETITLLQTGKAPIIPIVFLDAPGGNFWNTFVRYLKEHLLQDGLISASDFHLFKVTDDIEVARREIVNFY
ncbi:MAG: TIGR00730 family Rossman fold protein, partial [Verrucomicrobiota bacterium]